MNPLRAARLLAGPRAFTGAFAGAQINRHTADWNPSLLPADLEISTGIRVLRARSRDTHRNSAHAWGFTRDLRDNVIGVEEGGIRLQARNRIADGRTSSGPTTRFNKPLNDYLEGRWQDWGELGICTADGKTDFTELSRLYLTTLAVDGAVLWRELPGFDNEFGYAIELLDADQIDLSLVRPRGNGTNEIRYGVEVDDFNRVVAFHMWTRHPADFQRGERIRVDARYVHYDFLPMRVGQTHGLPWLTPILFLWRHWDGFTIAEVMQARAAACNGGYFTATGADAEHWLPPTGKPDGTDLTMGLEPNTWRQLPPGLTPVTPDPVHPNPNAPAFRRDILMSLAKGLGSSYTTASGDFANTNYSSGRMGLLPERDFFRSIARFVTRRLHKRVYRSWLQFAPLAGALQLPTRDLNMVSAHKWEYRGWPWIDPLNDMQANERKLRLGLTSRQRLCAELGLDFEETLDEIAAEEALAKDRGVDVSGIEYAGRITLPAPPPGDGTDDGTSTATGGGKPAALRMEKSA